MIVRRDVDPCYNNRLVYRIMKALNLLQKRKPRLARLRQTQHLFELLPKQTNELWQMDVTYLAMPTGQWWYITTVIDYYSRYLLACYLTPRHQATSVLDGLDIAEDTSNRIYGPMTEQPTLVTDNGSCFIAGEFQKKIKGRFEHVRIQYRTPQQLGLLERFHGTLKREEVHWRLFDNPDHARQCLLEFQDRYNTIRPHWALEPAVGGDPLTPQAVYVNGEVVTIPAWQGWAKRARQMLDDMLLNDMAQEMA